ncbi:unnamed protein product [Vicia faba]|uniref:RCD1 WWE domain-containing protein n=1 Tax=Vicia faba TaxID=3906 RepID=A0AAV0YQ33_VICFA|nr:unnamed protein product [Vicia faba]
MRLIGDGGQPAKSGLDISRSLVKYHFNYKKIGLSKYLLFYKNGEWWNYPEDVNGLVKKDFEIKKGNYGEPNILDEREDEESHGTEETYELKLHLSIHLNGADESKLRENIGESNALATDVDDHDHNHDTTNSGKWKHWPTANQDIYKDLDACIEPGYGILDVDFLHKIFLTGMTTFKDNEGDTVDIYRNSDILVQV